MLPLSGPGTDTGTSSPTTPTTSASAPTSRINRRKFMCWFMPDQVSVETMLIPARAGRQVAAYVVLVQCGGRGPKGARRFGRPWSCGVARRARRGVPGDRHRGAPKRTHGRPSRAWGELRDAPDVASQAAVVGGHRGGGSRVRLPGAGARERLAAVGAAHPGFRPAVRAAIE